MFPAYLCHPTVGNFDISANVFTFHNVPVLTVHTRFCTAYSTYLEGEENNVSFIHIPRQSINRIFIGHNK